MVDALSRLPTREFHVISAFHTDLMDKIKTSWIQDASLQALIQKLSTNNGTYKKYTWHNSQLRRKDKLVVGADDNLKLELLKHFHNSAAGGHSGVTATMNRIAAVVYWKGM